MKYLDIAGEYKKIRQGGAWGSSLERAESYLRSAVKEPSAVALDFRECLSEYVEATELPPGSFQRMILILEGRR